MSEPKTTNYSSLANLEQSLKMIIKNGRYRINKDQARELLMLIDQRYKDDLLIEDKAKGIINDAPTARPKPTSEDLEQRRKLAERLKGRETTPFNPRECGIPHVKS